MQICSPATYKGQFCQRLLIDGSYWVIEHYIAEKQVKEEKSSIMLRILFNRPKAFRIHKPNVQSVMLQGSTPDVDASRAWDSRGTGLKSTVLWKERIQQKWLATPVLAADGDETEITLKLTHTGNGLLTDNEL